MFRILISEVALKSWGDQSAGGGLSWGEGGAGEGLSWGKGSVGGGLSWGEGDSGEGLSWGEGVQGKGLPGERGVWGKGLPGRRGKDRQLWGLDCDLVSRLLLQGSPRVRAHPAGTPAFCGEHGGSHGGQDGLCSERTRESAQQ